MNTIGIIAGAQSWRARIGTLVVIACALLTGPAAASGSGTIRSPDGQLQPTYAGSPNHREIALRALELAVQAGFLDTSGITLQEIRNRLEAGAYSEDYDLIPGIVGEHFPDPWAQGPDFDFNGLYPFSKIPYGSLADPLSGWIRGSPHGYDPLHGYTWPGTAYTTIDWANAAANTFRWNLAVALYRAGHKAEAYECLGHLIHLLSDLSLPEHVNVVNHGMSLTSDRSGTFLDPDIVTLVVDEYELALAGGLELPDLVKLIPDQLGMFRTALASADTARIPRLPAWYDYFMDMAVVTATDSLVNLYYSAPAANGEWGHYMDGSGSIVEPLQYGITPPVKIGDRWTQVELKSTAQVGSGTVVPEADLAAMCHKLVPAAAGYCAGLILKFLKEAADAGTGVADAGSMPSAFHLGQNYPNPFNPSTTITYSVSAPSLVSLKIFDMLGREVATLVEGPQAPGEYMVEWDAHGRVGPPASGVYLCRLRAGPFTETRKMILGK